MKKIKLTLIALGVLMTVNTFAQEETTKAGTSLSVGVEVGIPTGDLKEGSKLGIGGSVKAAIPVITDGYVTISAGYMTFSGKSIDFGGQTFKNPSLNMIPIKAGFQYRFPGGLYLEPQLVP